MSSLFQRFHQLFWLFLPLLIAFIGLNLFYISSPKLVSTWLHNLPWLGLACIVSSAVIAVLFARSRLVILGLLSLIFAPDVTDTLAQFSSQYLTHSVHVEDVRLDYFTLACIVLLLTKDKGFSPINLFYTGAVIFALFGIGIVLIPLLAPYINQYINIVPISTIQDYWPQLSPYQILLTVLLISVGISQIFIRPDSSNIVIFFTSILALYIHLDLNLLATQAVIIFVALTICYAVIKDSFTMAFKDELTGIPSRRALMQYIQTLGRKYTVVMSDIDHFKKFNDRHGHDVGDEVLKLVASKLNKVTGGGKAFRFGGEEFVIVFPRKNANEVTPYVEVVRQVIADYDIALRTKPRPNKTPKSKSASTKKAQIVKVTSSFGIAQRTNQASSFEQAMKQADIALYAAKKAGRNCVVTSKQ